MTKIAGFEPKPGSRSKHRIAVLAYDGVVLGDLATPLEILGRVRDAQGQPCYEVRVCGIAGKVRSDFLQLLVPWSLSSVARADTIIVPGIDHLERTVPPTILRGSDLLPNEAPASRPSARCFRPCPRWSARWFAPLLPWLLMHLRLMKEINDSGD